MDFKVVTDDAVNADEYGGEATYELKGDAVLVVTYSVTFRDGNEPAGSPGRRIERVTTYGPSGWLRIEEAGTGEGG